MGAEALETKSPHSEFNACSHCTFLFSHFETKGNLECHLVLSLCPTNEKLKLREGQGLAQVTQEVRTGS